MSTTRSVPAHRHAIAARVALAGVLSVLAAWSLRAAFDDAAGSAVLWAVLAPVAAVTVWHAAVVYMGRSGTGAVDTVVGLLVMVGTAAVVTKPGADVRLGPSRLLTGALPAEAAGPELATVSALAGLTALVAVRLASRPTARLLPLAAPLCCLLLGLGLGAAVAPLPAWYVPAFGATAAVLMMLGPGHVESGRAGRTRLVSAAVIVMAAAATGTLVGPLATAERAPASVQELTDAAVSPRADTNPLVQYLALRNGKIPARLSGSASREVDLLRMVTFDRFDGLNWSVRGDYRHAGKQLAGPPYGQVASRPVTLKVELDDTNYFAWLPRAGWPSRISVANLGFDRNTGDVVVPAGQETPGEYEITGAEPGGLDQLAVDDPARTGAEPGPPLPTRVDSFLRDTTAGKPVGRDQFFSLYDRFKSTESTEFSRDTADDAPGGNGLYQISKLLTETKQGTSEQYASAFAVLCRAMGWDARVVLGFHPRWEGSRFTAEGKDVFAWVEVRFARTGWVTVDPTPRQETSEKKRDTDEGESSREPPKDDVGGAPRPDQQAPLSPDENAAPVGPAQLPGAGPNWQQLVLVVALVLLACVCAVPVAKSLRRMRARKAGSPRQRAMAAWRDMVESLRGAGIAVDRTATAGEIIDGVPASLAPLVSSLGDLVDHAMFAPEGIAADGADGAWRCNKRIRAQLRKETSPGRHLRNALNPKQLLPRRIRHEYRTILA
jgi:transglutaminase-like putative cysteine protease